MSCLYDEVIRQTRLEPLKEDFKKLREFLDRHSQPASIEATTPSAPVLNIEPPQPTQMDLFG